MKETLVAMLVVAGVTYSQSIAVVDSDRIFENFSEVADATELLEKEMEEWEAHADSLQEEIDAIRSDLEYTMVMSPEHRREREALLREKTAELQEFLAATFGPGGLVERRNTELVAPIVSRINEVVREISVEEDFDLVLDSSGGLVVYASGAIDITDMVLERLATGGEY